MNVMFLTKELATYLIGNDMESRYKDKFIILPGDVETVVINVQKFLSDYRLANNDKITYIKSKRKFAVIVY